MRFTQNMQYLVERFDKCVNLFFISHQGKITASSKQEKVYLTKIAELEDKLQKLEEAHGKFIII